MASKRKSDQLNIHRAKTIKQLNGNVDIADITLDTSHLSEEMTCTLEYDEILQEYVISLENKRKDGEKRFISFGAKENENIIRLIPSVITLIKRYSFKRSPRVLDVPFETVKANVGEMVTVLSLKENMYKRGYFDVDIRKCLKKEDGSYQYTTEGVRFTESKLSDVEKTLRKYESLIANVYVETSYVITMAMARAVIRTISELSDPKQNCHGCRIKHESQTEHMGPGGCLSEHQPEWSEVVEEFWEVARDLLCEEDVRNIAKQAVSKLPEYQKWFIPTVVENENIPEEAVKDIVMRQETLKDDSLYQAFDDIY